MCKATIRMVKGFLIGMMAGIVVGGIGSCCLQPHRRSIKKGIGHALRTVGELTDTVLGMF